MSGKWATGFPTQKDVKGFMHAITLYQFELCPFCNKARAGLDLRGLKYVSVEVNPMNKREISHIEADEDGRKKVPIIEFDGNVVRDSSVILRWAEKRDGNEVRLLREQADMSTRIEAIETWVDDYLMKVLPAVLYGTWSQAIRAARLTAHSGNFSAFDNFKVSVFGSIIMKMIAKRTLKKMGQGASAEELYSNGLDHLESLLVDKCLVGSQPSLADACVHGALTCVKDFPAFQQAMARPVIRSWYEHVETLRVAGRAFAQEHAQASAKVACSS
jgi:microsomal prostaglandin-E synthase 2